MNLRAINQVCICVLAVGCAAGASALRAQVAGPMTPPASTKLPHPYVGTDANYEDAIAVLRNTEISGIKKLINNVIRKTRSLA